MASVLKSLVWLACVARISSASPRNRTLAGTRFAALRGAAYASERPTLINTSTPMEPRGNCPGDEALSSDCLQQAGCTWSNHSGCQAWDDATYCYKAFTEHTLHDCEKEVIYHAGNKAVRCQLNQPRPNTWSCDPVDFSER
mmetsp:Transcript_3084/g.9371  ORF Transcript_3084/g.9371 Transcript_3084/m.9371 type:complete len:141 (-) Transcript_3084:246-668(-)